MVKRRLKCGENVTFFSLHIFRIFQTLGGESFHPLPRRICPSPRIQNFPPQPDFLIHPSLPVFILFLPDLIGIGAATHPSRPALYGSQKHCQRARSVCRFRFVSTREKTLI